VVPFGRVADAAAEVLGLAVGLSPGLIAPAAPVLGNEVGRGLGASAPDLVADGLAPPELDDAATRSTRDCVLALVAAG
jgi:hypothetical protein